MSLPASLRRISIAVMLIGALFKIQHWPWSSGFLITAWSIAALIPLVRVLRGEIVNWHTLVRDLFLLSLLGCYVMRALHLPGAHFVFVLLLLSGAGAFWSMQTRSGPVKWSEASQPWLFSAAMVLIIAGMLFRIQHWPYSTALLITGLVLAGLWVIVTRPANGTGD